MGLKESAFFGDVVLSQATCTGIRIVLELREILRSMLISSRQPSNGTGRACRTTCCYLLTGTLHFKHCRDSATTPAKETTTPKSAALLNLVNRKLLRIDLFRQWPVAGDGWPVVNGR